jgi:hypothetical protein
MILNVKNNNIDYKVNIFIEFHFIPVSILLNQYYEYNKNYLDNLIKQNEIINNADIIHLLCYDENDIEHIINIKNIINHKYKYRGNTQKLNFILNNHNEFIKKLNKEKDICIKYDHIMNKIE